ncbi:MAG: RNA methyltransferase [Bacteroidetes bacterium]|nr:RNA methyltransferase [Bacteroidota bacterium]
MEALERVSVETFKEALKTPIVAVLDNIRSLHNVGAVFRTADAFSIQHMVLCGITATPPHKELRKTALGATESVSWEYSNTTLEAIERLKSEGYVIVAAEQTEHSIELSSFAVDTKKQYALIFGHEVNGVDQAVLDHCDAVVEINQSGTKHSLNVSVSAGIVLWHFYRFLGK